MFAETKTFSSESGFGFPKKTEKGENHYEEQQPDQCAPGS